MKHVLFGLGVVALACTVEGARAADVPVDQSADTLQTVVVVGRQRNLVGEAISASEGEIGQEEIAERPMVRTGDLMEFVPGMVATQHSGSGKANQYFLRGFNLDHGTDFSTSVDSMPVNMRTHGHGQGYSDLNFLIPETVQTLTYRKGTYYADVGDFSSAGSAKFSIADRVPEGVAELTLGRFGYGRTVAVDSFNAGAGDWLLGGELQTYDGPWTDLNEDVRKKNFLARYSNDIAGGRAHLTFMGYDNKWNSPDQIPDRAVRSDLISEYGSIDTTLGGQSSRYSLSGGWQGAAMGGELNANAYLINYDFKLWSNFTYFLDDPVHGDQFEQVDHRKIVGFDVSQQWGDRDASRWRVGTQGRYDDIGQVGLFRTERRERIAAIRDDSVNEGSIGVYLANETRWTDTLRSYVGVRYDSYSFDVSAIQPENSGNTRDATPSTKASLIWHPTDPLEFYLSWGQGFHSNDARGTTLRVDPVTGEPADKVNPLVNSVGSELGTRLHFSDRLNATLAVWQLSLDSELLFVGDAGNTEASRPSHREGIEVGLYWYPSDRITAELETSFTRSNFRDSDPVGDHIPGAIPFVASATVQADLDDGWYATARLRHFGPYPLIEDNSVKSNGSTVLNFRLGKRWQQFGVSLDLLNALDSRDHDIDYFYASRLPGEPEDGIEDDHYHPLEPRSLRLTARWKF